MLTNRQKFILSDLARQAHARALAASGLPADDFMDEKDFRHEEVARACGKLGLRCCTQMDYAAVEAHFLALLGREAEAQQARLRAGTEARRQAAAVLERELARFGFHRGYAEAIARSKFKRQISECSEKQTWVLVYDIRRNGAARAKVNQPF